MHAFLTRRNVMRQLTDCGDKTVRGLGRGTQAHLQTHTRRRVPPEQGLDRRKARDRGPRPAHSPSPTPTQLYGYKAASRQAPKELPKIPRYFPKGPTQACPLARVYGLRRVRLYGTRTGARGRVQPMQTRLARPSRHARTGRFINASV